MNRHGAARTGFLRSPGLLGTRIAAKENSIRAPSSAGRAPHYRESWRGMREVLPLREWPREARSGWGRQPFAAAKISASFNKRGLALARVSTRSTAASLGARLRFSRTRSRSTCR